MEDETNWEKRCTGRTGPRETAQGFDFHFHKAKDTGQTSTAKLTCIDLEIPPVPAYPDKYKQNERSCHPYRHQFLEMRIHKTDVSTPPNHTDKSHRWIIPTQK